MQSTADVLFRNQATTLAGGGSPLPRGRGPGREETWMATDPLVTMTLLVGAWAAFAWAANRAGKWTAASRQAPEGFDETDVAAYEEWLKGTSPRGPMWGRFSRQAQQVVCYAQEEAVRRNGTWVGPEHLLLGLLQDPDTAATRVLAGLGIPVEHVRAELKSRLVEPEIPPGKQPQLTTSGKRVIDRAYEASRNLGSEYLGTHHLLLGVIDVKGAAREALEAAGVELAPARELAH